MSINFSDNDILKIIRSLDINKAHGHDDISVRMVKICDDGINKPLSIIYKNCIKTGIYPNTWKFLMIGIGYGWEYKVRQS